MSIKTLKSNYLWMLPLFAVQFFTWLGFFSLWIYATPVFTKYIFKVSDTESDLYEQGIRWVGISFAFYSSLAAILAFSIPYLLKKISVSRLHSIGLLIGGIGMMLIYFVSSPFQILLPFFFIGIAWSVVSNLPYKIIGDKSAEDAITKNMMIFNFSIVIPQVTAAFLLSFMTSQLFRGETIFTLIFGGSCLVLASIICFLLV